MPACDSKKKRIVRIFNSTLLSNNPWIISCYAFFIFQSRKVSKFFFALRGYKLRIDIIKFRIRFRIAVVFYHFNTLMNWNADAKKNYNQILRYNTMRNATYTDARGPIVATFFHHKTWYAHLHIANSHTISLIEFTLLSLARAINRRDI